MAQTAGLLPFSSLLFRLLLYRKGLSLRDTSIDLIKKIISYDTTSRNSNLELIHFIRDYLKDLGIESLLVHDDAGTKANLYATLGPADRPGICSQATPTWCRSMGRIGIPTRSMSSKKTRSSSAAALAT